MQPTSPSQREALEEATAAYVSAVTGDVARYLLNRGIEEETAHTFRLGVVDDPIPGHEARRGRLAIPFLHRSGYPLTIRFRCLRDHDCRDVGCPKYLPIEGDMTRMFNTAALYQADREIHVTEGEFDAMVLHQIGLPAVGIAGANGWKSHYSVLLAGFSRVWVWGDPDQAGSEFVNELCRRMRQARGVRIKGGDITEVYLEQGANALHELVEWEGR